jgi:acyl carrier protein
VSDRTQLFESMKKIICEQLDAAPDVVTEQASFVDDLGADSLAVVELVLALEEAFGVNIPDEDAEKLRTVGDAVSYVLAHGGAGLQAAG